VAELLRRAECLPGDGARREGEILLGHCLQKSRTWLYAWPEADVAPACEEQFAELLSERARGVPVAYLTGRREFWSMELAVNEHTLIPRPETETLVQWALDLDLPAQSTVLDLGTGSGAIALALARERPTWRVTAVDTSREALAVARENGRRFGLDSVRLLQSDWFGALMNEHFDLIVSNPPYVAEGDPHLAVGDLHFEPTSALVAAQSGLADLARIVTGAIRHLVHGGWLLLEHGSEQGEPVRQMLEEARFAGVATRSDLAGLDRVSGGRRHAE
jgi:release factor glutamine methyltransferase